MFATITTASRAAPAITIQSSWRRLNNSRLISEISSSEACICVVSAIETLAMVLGANLGGALPPLAHASTPEARRLPLDLEERRVLRRERARRDRRGQEREDQEALHDLRIGRPQPARTGLKA